MQKIIDAYLAKNHHLAVFKDLLAGYDGKALNKRFENYLKKHDCEVCINHTIYSTEFIVYSLPRITFGGNTILTIYGEDWDMVCVDGKLSAKDLTEHIDRQIASNQERIAKIKDNEAHKDELISQYNKLVEQVEALTKTMDYEFKEYYKNEFTPIIYKCGR